MPCESGGLGWGHTTRLTQRIEEGSEGGGAAQKGNKDGGPDPALVLSSRVTWPSQVVPCASFQGCGSYCQKPCGTTLSHGRLGSGTNFSPCLFPNFSPMLRTPVTSLLPSSFLLWISGALCLPVPLPTPTTVSLPAFHSAFVCLSLSLLPSFSPLFRYNCVDQGPSEQRRPAGHRPQEN